VEILGLEVPLYACFTCGYAGVTPSGADNPHDDEVHVHDLLAEVKRLRKALHIEQQIVEAFYQYRMECCFDHCEAWMVEQGYRVVVLEDEDDPTSGVTEWACEVGQ